MNQIIWKNTWILYILMISHQGCGVRSLEVIKLWVELIWWISHNSDCYIYSPQMWIYQEVIVCLRYSKSAYQFYYLPVKSWGRTHGVGVGKDSLTPQPCIIVISDWYSITTMLLIYSITEPQYLLINGE